MCSEEEIWVAHMRGAISEAHGVYKSHPEGSCRTFSEHNKFLSEPFSILRICQRLEIVPKLGKRGPKAMRRPRDS